MPTSSASTSARVFEWLGIPDPESRLGYLIWLPIEGGLVLKSRDTWPRANRIFCAQDATAWDESADLLDDVEVLLCRRRGAAIDLVLDRPSLARSQFVFTQARGRPAIWWQTQKTAQAANPGARIPRGRAVGPLRVAVDTREKYGWKFAGRTVTLIPRPLPAGDYAAAQGDDLLAVVERKTLENLATSLSDGSLVFQLQRLAEMARAAIVVEATTRIYSALKPVAAPGLPTCWLDLPSATPRCRSYSLDRASLPRNGPTVFSLPPSATSSRTDEA